MRWNRGRVLLIGVLLLFGFFMFTKTVMQSNFVGSYVDDIFGKNSRLISGKIRSAPLGQCPQDFASWPGNYVFITVKTTAANHKNRLRLLMQTWIPTALALKGKGNSSLVKVSLVSDQVDDLHNAIVGGRMIQSQCPSSHNKTDLCCKMSTEFDLYFAEKNLAPWFCHFDDDNYVNVYNLLNELKKLDSKQAFYIGKSSRGKSKLKDTLSMLPMPLWGRAPAQFITFSFGTGGAGFCMSHEAMQKIKVKVSRLYGGTGLDGLCKKMAGLADDVAVGYVNGYYNITLTEIPTFHSHLEKLSKLSILDIRQAISLSYTKYRSYENTAPLPAEDILPKSGDPSRLLSVHKFLTLDC